LSPMKTARMVKYTIPLPPSIVRALQRRAKLAAIGARKLARLIITEAVSP
jgi:hypothetical protein